MHVRRPCCQSGQSRQGLWSRSARAWTSGCTGVDVGGTGVDVGGNCCRSRHRCRWWRSGRSGRWRRRRWCRWFAAVGAAAGAAVGVGGYTGWSGRRTRVHSPTESETGRSTAVGSGAAVGSGTGVSVGSGVGGAAVGAEELSAQTVGMLAGVAVSCATATAGAVVGAAWAAGAVGWWYLGAGAGTSELSEPHATAKTVIATKRNDCEACERSASEQVSVSRSQRMIYR